MKLVLLADDDETLNEWENVEEIIFSWSEPFLATVEEAILEARKGAAQ